MDIVDKGCGFNEKNPDVYNTYLQKLLEDIKSFEFEHDINILEERINDLKEVDENITMIHEQNSLELLNECIGRINNYIFHTSFNNVFEHIIFRKLLFLLTEKKLNISEKDLKSNDLRLSVINNGCTLVKMCIENECPDKSDYYIYRTEHELNVLIEFYDQSSLSNKEAWSKKLELTMYHVQKMMMENKVEKALEELNRKKSYVIDSMKYRDYYVALCYNAALKFNATKNYDYTLTALLLAYDICKMSDPLSGNMKTILRFLVCVCLKYNPDKNWECALNALDLAFREKMDIFYIISKMKFAIISQQQSVLEKLLFQVVEWESVEINVVNQILGFLHKNNVSLFVAEFLQAIRYKFVSTSDQFLLMKWEVQFSISESDRRVFSVVENCIQMARTNRVPKSSINDLYKLLLSHADNNFNEKVFGESIKWYSYCAQLSEIDSSDTTRFCYVQSRICLCYLEMRDWESAKKVFLMLKTSSEAYKPDFVYIAFQIAFIEGNEKLLEETLRSCIQHENDNKVGDILLACCHKALMAGLKDVLYKILDALILEYQTFKGTILSAKLAQCLIILSGNYTDEKDIQNKYLLYMDKALHAFQKNVEQKETSELSQWFSRAAWNLALKPDTAPKYMFELFLRCCCFSELSTRNLNRLKNSLMLAAASGLCVVRQMTLSDDRNERETCLGKIMTVIEKCKSLETGTNVTLLRLLYLYEFETRCHLNEWKDVMSKVENILHLPFMDVKTLEHIAAIVNEFSPRNYQLIMESLKVAVQKISDDQHHGALEASKTYHCLIQLLFYVQEYISSSVEEENFIVCKRLSQQIEDKFSDNYPQLEILWLMAKCWNWGIHKLTLNDSETARRWCTLAIAFLQKLESMKALYEKKLKDTYSAYFSNLEEQNENSENASQN